ncbi:protein of unknown function [Micromonospora pallida]|uniref:DUF4352 domain-containing protein n=1 Tax=Micromonospora pallida TaxID=145854 RepID=A0A1C6T4Y8_9ACTN|nr:DUF4352 domain-containing protein [Micromonospora pallida]SCL36465.1 protein of unknown function [Micromonospora pallida]
MSHPPGPPQDPFQPDPDPYAYSDPQYYPDPTAAPPLYPSDPPAYPPGVGSPYQSYPPEQSTPPYPTSGAPGAGYPPVSGAPGYPPPSSGGPGYPPPVSGAPGYPPPTSGAPGYPGAPGHPAAGVPYPPGPTPMASYPAGPPGPYPGLPLPPSKSSGGGGGKTALIGVAVVVVLVLLCCVGSIFVVLASDDGGTQGTGIGQAPTPGSQGAPLVRPTDAQPFGATEPTTAAPEPTGSEQDGETFNMKAGDTLVITDDEGTVEITIDRFTTSNKGCRSFAPDPDEGMYLIADVTVRVTKGTASVNPFYFEWVGQDGKTANGLVGALSGCGSPLASGVDLRSGSKRTGTVVFDVADKKGVVEYQHNFEAAGSWKP